MNANETSFSQFKKDHCKNEGLVFLGVGGDLQEWVDGIPLILNKENIIPSKTPENTFSGVYTFKTTGGRTDLAFVFKEGADIKIGILAVWRLMYGGCSWISDYIVNYADQH